MKLFALATLSALLATASAIPAYSDHAVLSVTPSDDHELKQLLELGLDLEGETHSSLPFVNLQPLPCNKPSPSRPPRCARRRTGGRRPA